MTVLPDRMDQVARGFVSANGTEVQARRGINFIDGTNTTVTATDDQTDEEIDVTISAATDPFVLPGDLVLPVTSGKGVKRGDADTSAFGWRDLIGSVDPKTSGANTPALGAWRGGNVSAFYFTGGDILDLTFHMPHDWVPDTDLFIHVHWGHNGTAISGSFVCDFYTTFAKAFDQEVFPAEVNTTLTVSTPDVTTIPRWQHMTSEVQLSAGTPSANQIDTDSLEVDGLLLIRMISTTIPTITGGSVDRPFVFTVDIHYQSHGAGTTTAKAPDFYTVV